MEITSLSCYDRMRCFGICPLADSQGMNVRKIEHVRHALPYVVGQEAEALVNRVLFTCPKANRAFLTLHNMTLPTPVTGHCEIDNVVISTNFIACIEVKHKSSAVVKDLCHGERKGLCNQCSRFPCNTHTQMWTATQSTPFEHELSMYTNKPYNPVGQNSHHCDAIAKLLNKIDLLFYGKAHKRTIHNIVCYSSSGRVHALKDYSKEKYPVHVITVEQLMPLLLSFRNNIDPRVIQELGLRLLSLRSAV